MEEAPEDKPIKQEESAKRAASLIGGAASTGKQHREEHPAFAKEAIPPTPLHRIAVLYAYCSLDTPLPFHVLPSIL